MQYMMLIYESFKNFEARTTDKTSAYVAAWRAYHRSLVESGVFVGEPRFSPRPAPRRSGSETAGEVSRTAPTPRPRSCSQA
jgi:hypothetical protein